MKPLTDLETAAANAMARDIVLDTLLAHAIHTARDPDAEARAILSFSLNSVDFTQAGSMTGEPNADAICEHMRAVIRERVTAARHHRRDGRWQD